MHIQSWLARVDEIVGRGKGAYLADELLQKAGDSQIMKLGEAANRLSRLGVLAPDGVEWHLVRRDQPRAHLADARRDVAEPVVDGHETKLPASALRPEGLLPNADIGLSRKAEIVGASRRSGG